MPGQIHRLSTYSFRDTDRLLFDANIWLFLYSPQYGPTDSRVRVYSAALKNILIAHSCIFVDALVLSEFINAWARFTYNKLSPQTKPKDFKTYRNSSAFKSVGKGIADACRRILGHATRIESGFPSLDIDSVLNGYEAGKADFNDYVLAELCVTKGFTFVTNDGDLKGLSLTILTENRNLLT
jgi:predicted nucleic acid-binding protein